VKPFSASLLLHLRRLARGRGVRVLVSLLAFALIANATVVVALPAVAAAHTQEASANSAHEACAQHAAPATAQASHRHQHADDCLCCVGKLCACGPLCGAVTFTALPTGVNPAQAAIAPASLPRAYITRSSRPLRPPPA